MWGHYLSAWASDGQIFCLRDKNIFETSIKNVGNRRDFYKLKKLTKEDLKFIDQIYFQAVEPEYFEINKQIIPLFNSIFEIKERLKSTNIQHEELEKELDIGIYNLLEDFHSDIEKTAIPLLESLKNEDFSVLDNNQSLKSFLFYLCLQYFRTSARREATLSIKSVSQFPEVEKTWNMLSLIYANSVAHTLFKERSLWRFILLKPRKSAFITGDQPILNTHVNYNVSKIMEADEYELFYPLSPTIALLLTKSNEYTNHDIKTISEIRVIHYNNHIFYASHDQVYSNQAELLKDLLKIPDRPHA